MTHVLRVPDKELVATAGIDALAFIRVCQFGIQLFVPISLVVVIVFIPVHVSGDDLARQKNEFIAQGGSTESLRSGLNSRIMRTTAANLPEGANVLWLYVFTFWGIVLYSTWLLRRHTRTFALLRQLYLTTAGDTNLWRAVHMPTTILQQMLVQGREMEAEMNGAKCARSSRRAPAPRASSPGTKTVPIPGISPGTSRLGRERGRGRGASEEAFDRFDRGRRARGHRRERYARRRRRRERRRGCRRRIRQRRRSRRRGTRVRHAERSGNPRGDGDARDARASVGGEEQEQGGLGGEGHLAHHASVFQKVRPRQSLRRRRGRRPSPPRRSGWGCTRSSPRAITTARGFPRWRRMTATAAGRRIRG